MLSTEDTTKRPKNITDVYSGVKKNSADRRENDFYPTPPLPVWILGKYTKIPKKVIEPCAGVGNVSIQLVRMGHEVLSYDLVEHPGPLIDGIITGVDATTLEPPEDVGEWGLITNPPYHQSLPAKLAEKSITDGYGYTGFLVRLTYLEGIKRRRDIFSKTPPTHMIFFSDRINFSERKLGTEPIEYDDQAGGMISYSWLVWDRKHPNWGTKNTECHWVSLKEEYPEWLEHYEETRT